MKFLKPIMCSLLVAMMANAANAAPTKLTEISSNDDILRVLPGTWFSCFDDENGFAEEENIKSSSIEITFVIKEGKLVNMPQYLAYYDKSGCKGNIVDSEHLDFDDSSYTLNLSNDGKKLIVDFFDDYIIFTKKK